MTTDRRVRDLTVITTRIARAWWPSFCVLKSRASIARSHLRDVPSRRSFCGVRGSPTKALSLRHQRAISARAAVAYSGGYQHNYADAPLNKVRRLVSLRSSG
jgi:hypothetical protein